MIDESHSKFYLSYFAVAVCLIIAYVKIKSSDSVYITTKEFKTFQSSFLNGYSMMILFEVIATASFFHTFLSMNMSLEKITNLYIVTTISTSIFNVLLEIIDIGSKKDKCILSTILYCVSMSSVFLGGHHKMLSLGRIAYGAGAALQHSVFEAYVIHEHTTRGFLDDWLTQTFSLLTHSMTLIAVVAGFSGQLVSSSQYGPVGLCWILCIISGFYILTTWSKDTSVGSKFLLSGFIFNVNQTVTTIKNSKATLLLLVISALFESTITIFTFYWAPWLLSTIGYSNEHSIPYEILFSTFVGCSMLGNYIYQIGGGNFVLFGTFDVTLQSILISASTIFALGAMLQTTLFAYITCLLVHLFIGGYWSSIGALRGSIILPEQRNTWQLFVKIITTIISSATLATIHHSPMMMLLVCSVLAGSAAYLQGILLLQEDLCVQDDDEEM